MMDLTNELRTCTKCGLTFELDKFPKLKAGRLGKGARCKSCANKIQAQYRKTEKGRSIVKNWNDSEKGKAARDKYMSSFIGKEYIEGCKSESAWKEKNRLYRAAYRNTKNGRVAIKKARAKENAKPINREKQRYRAPVSAIITGRVKYTSWVTEFLGLDVNEFRKYIFKKLRAKYPSWTMDDYGILWEIDHIKPFADFDVFDKDQMRTCWHYTNLQPLCCIENRRQSGDYLNKEKKLA